MNGEHKVSHMTDAKGETVSLQNPYSSPLYTKNNTVKSKNA